MAMIEDFLARHKIGGTWRDSMQTATAANAESARRAHARNLDNMWRARNLRFAQDSAKRNEKNAVRLEKQINAGTALWKDNLGKISKQFDKLASQKLDPVTETRALRSKIDNPNGGKNAKALGDKIEKPKSNLSKFAKLGAAATLGVGAAGFLASSASAREKEDYSAKEKQEQKQNQNVNAPPESSANSTPDNTATITPPADNKDLTKLSAEIDGIMKPPATTIADDRQPTRPSADVALDIPDKTDREISTLFDNTEKLVEDHAKAVQEALRAASEETEKTIEGTTGKGVKGSAVSATPTTLTNNAVGVSGVTPANNITNSSVPAVLNPDFGVAGKGGGTGSATSSGVAFGAPASRIKEGRATSGMPAGIGAQGSTGRATDSKSLARNKQEAFNAARAEGLSSHDAKILVANMEGESLRNPSAHNQDYNKYGQPVHMAQGIVQWDPFRSARIAKEFGKQPKDMTVAEQTKASIWEMKNFYPKAWSVFSDPNATKEQKMWAVVKHYENPARPEADTNKRLGYLQNLNVREDGSFADASSRISAQASNAKPYGGYEKSTNADGSITVTAGQGGYKSSVFNNPEDAKIYLRSVSAIGSSASIMKKYGYDSINDMNDEAALKAATAFYKYNQDAKANGLVPATLNSAARLPLPDMPGGFANKQNSAHAGTMAFDVGFKGVMQNTGNNIYSFENYAKKEGLFSGRSIYGNHEGHHFSLVPDKHNPFKGNYDATGRPLDLDKMKRATVSGFVATYPKDKASEAKQIEAKSENKSEVARYTPPVVPNMTTPSEDIKPAGAGENYDAPKSETKADTGGASGNTETSNSAGGKDTFEDHSENDINFKKPG